MSDAGDAARADKPGLIDRIKALVAVVKGWKPVRVWDAYTARRGPVLAAGLGFQALFAVFAAIWAAFSLAGMIVTGDLDLREQVLQLLRDAIPGLIQDETGQGAVAPQVLLSAGVYGVSGVIALVGLVFTALRWPAAAGSAVRAVLGLPLPTTNALLRRLRELAFGVGLAIMLGISAAAALSATSASGILIRWIGLDSSAVIVAGRVISIGIVVILEAVTLIGVYRVLAGVRFPGKILAPGVLIGTVGLAALTVGGSLLLGAAGGNPLIASFAVVAGLLIFFNFVAQVILIAAAWMAVSAEDAGIDLEPDPGEEEEEAADFTQVAP